MLSFSSAVTGDGILSSDAACAKAMIASSCAADLMDTALFARNVCSGGSATAGERNSRCVLSDKVFFREVQHVAVEVNSGKGLKSVQSFPTGFF